MTDSLAQFEESYWKASEQTEAFRHRQALEWLHAEDAPVVDIGCGDGFFLEKLKQRGIACWGVDISVVAVEKCVSKGLDAAVGNFANGEIPNRALKTAVLLDVLEHLYDPIPVLHTLHERAEGLIISVPNFVSLPARMQVLFGKVPENNTPRKGHVYWYTKEVLRKRLEESGWIIERIGVNPPWVKVPVIGSLMILLARKWPSVFSLSLVVRAKKV